MIAAIFIILLTTILAYIDKRKKWNWGIIIAFGIITIFAGMRYGYGSDYMEYLKNFQTFQYSKITDDLSGIRTESGWNYLCIVSQPIGFFGLMILLALVEYLIICRFIVKYVPFENHWLALLCFTLNTNLFLLGLTMIRQFLAMCFILLATDFIIRKKWVISFGMVLFASLFHSSALIFIPFCFIGYFDIRKWGKDAVVLLVVLIVFLYFTGAYLLGDFVQDLLLLDQFSAYGTEYVTKEETPSLWSIPRLYELFLLFCLLFNYKSYTKEQAVIVFLFSMGYLFNGFIALSSMAARLTLYFSIYGVVCIPLIVKHIKDRASLYFFMSLYLFYLGYRFFAFFNSPTWKSFLNYHTILETQWQ